MADPLSVLRNAGPGHITYYVGTDPVRVAHLSDCTLYCGHELEVELPGVELIRCEDPQLEFYKLSAQYKEDPLDRSRIKFNEKYQAFIHEEAQIGEDVRIGPGTTIAKAVIEDGVTIDSNVTIYSKTTIKRGSIIQSNTTIGSYGMMWVWDRDKKVFLEQLGGVVIEENCQIGSQVEITRGSANENTVIGEGTCMAHGCMLGHGCRVGAFTHMANGVLLGGGVELSGYNFIGSGVIISSGVRISEKDVVLGAGTTVMANITKSGVYVGTPARRIKDSGGKLAGMPNWRERDQ